MAGRHSSSRGGGSSTGRTVPEAAQLEAGKRVGCSRTGELARLQRPQGRPEVRGAADLIGQRGQLEAADEVENTADGQNVEGECVSCCLISLVSFYIIDLYVLALLNIKAHTLFVQLSEFRGKNR